MSFSLVYLANRFFYRIIEFLRHWYVGGFYAVSRRVLVILEALDRRLALKITLRHFFQPLYQDYTLAGYIFGLFFRSARILIAVFLYILVLVFGTAAYLVWAGIPIYILSANYFINILDIGNQNY